MSALALAAFWPCTGGSYVWDDFPAVLLNPDVKAGIFDFAFVSNDFWGESMSTSTSHKSYRPVTVFSFILEHAAVSGFRPFVSHAVNIALHALNAILLYTLAIRLKAGKASGVLAAAIFILHPIQTESVCSVVGRADLLACSFTLLAAIASLRWLTFGPSQAGSESPSIATPAAGASSSSSSGSITRTSDDGSTAVVPVAEETASSDYSYHVAVVVSLCAAAMLSKETGIASFAIVFLIVVLQPSFQGSHSHFLQAAQKPRGASSGDVRRTASLIAACAAVVLGWRLSLNDFTSPSWSHLENFIASLPTASARGMTVAWTHLLYLSMLLWPFGRLSAMHGPGSFEPVLTVDDPRAWLVIAVYAAFCAWMSRTVYRVLVSDHSNATEASGSSPRMRLFVVLGLALAPFAPASNVFFYIGAAMGDRFMSLPMVGVSMLVADLVVTGFESGAVRGASSGSGSECKHEAPTSAAGHKGSVSTPDPAGAPASNKVAAMSRLKRLIIAAVLTSWTLASRLRSYDWRSERSLFVSAVRTHPGDVMGLTNLAQNLEDALPAGPVGPLTSPHANASAASQVSVAEEAGREISAASLHATAELATAVAEACLLVDPRSPFCWSTLGLLVMRPGLNLSSRVGHSTPEPAEDGRGHAAAMSHSMGRSGDAGAAQLALSAVGRKLDTWMASATDSVKSLLHGPTDALDLAAVLAVLRSTLPGGYADAAASSVVGNEYDSASFTDGDRKQHHRLALALEYLWKAVATSAETSQPCPCKTMVAISRVYLDIAKQKKTRKEKGKATMSAAAAASPMSDDVVVDELGLPHWAAVSGGDVQRRHLLELRSRLTKAGQSAHSTADASLLFSLQMLAHAIEVDCGSHGAVALDLSDNPGAFNVIGAEDTARGMRGLLSSTHVNRVRVSLLLQLAEAQLLSGDPMSSLAMLSTLPERLLGKVWPGAHHNRPQQQHLSPAFGTFCDNAGVGPGSGSTLAELHLMTPLRSDSPLEARVGLMLMCQQPASQQDGGDGSWILSPAVRGCSERELLAVSAMHIADACSRLAAPMKRAVRRATAAVEEESSTSSLSGDGSTAGADAGAAAASKVEEALGRISVATQRLCFGLLEGPLMQRLQEQRAGPIRIADACREVLDQRGAAFAALAARLRSTEVASL